MFSCGVQGTKPPPKHRPFTWGLRAFRGGLRPGRQSEDGGPLAREHRSVPHSVPPPGKTQGPPAEFAPPRLSLGIKAQPPSCGASAMGGQHPRSPPRSGSSSGPRRLVLCGLAWASRHHRQLFVYGKLRSPSQGPPTNLNEGRAGLFLRPPRASCAPGRAGQAPRKRPGSP